MKPRAERLRALLPVAWELVRPRWRSLAGGFALMVVNRVAGLALPVSTKILIDDVITRHRMELLGPLVAAVLLATFLQGGTSYALTQLISKNGQRLITELREKVQRHVIRLGLPFFDANRSGALVSRIMNDVEGIRNLIGTGLIELSGGLLSAALAVALMLRISTTMTALTVGFLIAFAAALFVSFRTIRPSFRERGRIQAEVTGRLAESLGGIRVVKGYHREESEAAVFAAGARRLLDNVLKTLGTLSLMGLSASMMIGLVGATITYVGARQIVAGSMTVGGLFTYTILLGFLVAPIAQVVSIGTQLSEALAGLERTRELLAEKTEEDDPRRTLAAGELRGEIVFEDVEFAYSAGSPVLRGLSLSAAPGTVTALVGPSGAGKSTVIGLVASFYTPSSGRILVDGKDLAQLRLDSYRSRLGVVLQETFLFDGTIRENVLFSSPGASEEQMLAACRVARVDEFALGFPARYDTIVGERGIKLSGGQRQRVAIARAILADPRILILDEATSSLDSESEAFIQAGLAHLMRGRTTFVIAHRLSTIRRADQILVLQAGEIVERGTHASLYALHGRYFEMYTRQHAVESNLFLAPGEGGEPREAESPAKERPGSWLDPLRA